MIQGLVDTFFLYCHNQPYSLFQESKFRERIETGLVSEYLTLIFLACSLRFSRDPYFEGHQSSSARLYAAESWRVIWQQSQNVDHEGSLEMVQALLLHSVFDFTGSDSAHSLLSPAQVL